MLPVWTGSCRAFSRSVLMPLPDGRHLGVVYCMFWPGARHENRVPPRRTGSWTEKVFHRLSGPPNAATLLEEVLWRRLRWLTDAGVRGAPQCHNLLGAPEIPAPQLTDGRIIWNLEFESLWCPLVHLYLLLLPVQNVCIYIILTIFH